MGFRVGVVAGVVLGLRLTAVIQPVMLPSRAIGTAREGTVEAPTAEVMLRPARPAVRPKG